MLTVKLPLLRKTIKPKSIKPASTGYNKSNDKMVYKEEVYEEYRKNKNKKVFEKVIEEIMLADHYDENFKPIIEEIRNIVRQHISNKKKRFSILSVLDKNIKILVKLKVFANTDITKMEHIKDVIEKLRDYVKVSDTDKKLGEVMTPWELVKEMLNSLPKDVWSNPNLKWLDPANGVGPFLATVVGGLMKGLSKWEPDEYKRYKHILNNMVYAGELQPKNMFLYMMLMDPHDEFGMNIYTGSFLDGGFDKHMKEVWGIEKFDFIIGNPPYNQMIDMDFVKKSHSISNNIMYVHPSSWLLDEKEKQKKFISTKELIQNDLEKIVLFNGNGVFGISLFVPCVITYINKNKKTKGIKCIDRINSIDITYENIWQINKFSNQEIYTPLKEKILKASSVDNLLNHLSKSKNDTYYVNVAQIRGDVKNRDKKGVGMDTTMVAESFYTMITKALVIENAPKQQPFSFNTEQEANNFLNYIKTDFARFCLSIYKNNQNQHRGELKIIPWLDFTKQWTDEILYKHFDLSDKEIEFIDKIIPKYY